jgi:sporulation protein YlmC with PRC-barrel domain
MMIALEKLLHLPVETAAGERLGTVVSLDLDVEEHAVMYYVVKPALVPRLLATELIISPRQVISISQEKMVVEDAVIKKPVTATAPTPTI